MPSNLQPGDRAWVINCEAPETAWTISHVVTVAQRCDCANARKRGRGGAVWMLDQPLTHRRADGLLAAMICLPSWCLKRIPPEAEPAPGQRQPIAEEVAC